MRALVLSGGGLFGAYQAGAWQVLSRRFQPDIVVGLSIGAINGYLIASGERPEDLVARWSTLEGFSKPNFRPRWNFLEGFADAAPFEAVLREICGKRPRIPLAIVATDLFGLRPKVFHGDEITWRHLAASCALFGILPQYRIDGRRYSDGGMFDRFPAWAAHQLGATSIVGIDLLPPRIMKLVRGPLMAMRALSGFRAATPVPLVRITAGEPLGNLRAAYLWNRDNALRWIDLGRRHAELVELPEPLPCGSGSVTPSERQPGSGS